LQAGLVKNDLEEEKKSSASNGSSVPDEIDLIIGNLAPSLSLQSDQSL
jgi:hypothetical protein